MNESALGDKILNQVSAVHLPGPRGLLRHVGPEEIPSSEDLMSAPTLEARLGALAKPSWSLIAVGDIMLGGRARKVIAEQGDDYPFAAVQPLLHRAPLVLGNLEGPFARKAPKMPRNHSYKVNPKLAASLKRAGINVVSLANNHLLDCGRTGVVETLDALAQADVAAIGGGSSEAAAHAPVICRAGPWRIGLLSYYWNRRCAATATLPGSAMDTPAALEANLRRLRGRVDRIVVSFHWGVPYVREPSGQDQAKARLAVDCGADVVIGHHPHIVQPLEVYRGRPIFYSVGNFVLGSGNSRAEGLLLGLHFDENRTVATVVPLYVKNRDPRVAYQPKVLHGAGADRILKRLAEISGPSGAFLEKDRDWGRLELARSTLGGAKSEVADA